MTRNCINIAFSCNNGWIDKLATTVVSILKHADKNDFYKFYILDSNITEYNKQKLLEIKSNINFDIEYLKIDASLFKNAPVTHHFKVETYYRLSLPSIIDVDKLIYLDVDTLVMKNIAELYNIELNNAYAAAVEDILSITTTMHKLDVKRYFNAGVMLLNLKKIREDNLEEQFFDVVNNHSELISWVDQCVLNYVFKENVLFLDETYNFQHQDSIPIALKNYKKKKNNIMVLHFVSQKKPWNFDKTWNLNLLYYYYYLQTPFRKFAFKIFLNKHIVKIKLTYLLLFAR